LSSTSLILFCGLTLASVACSSETTCPALQDKHPLSSVILFDGPPEEKADLMPDASTGKGDQAVSTWNVGYIFTSGRKLFLVCKYSGTPQSGNVTVKVEKKVDRCVFRAPSKDRPAELTCQ
jgi:hypothetical protein